MLQMKVKHRVNSLLNKFFKYLTILIFFVLLTVLPAIVRAQKAKFDMKNQFSGWTVIQQQNPYHFQIGSRYLPTLNFSKGIGKNGMFDTEVAVNAYGNLSFKQTEYVDGEKEIDPYRLWIRYSTPRFEIRAGLQKINFGSATIFRPLMWFDKMDFRDPLQLTNGVYGLLGRYYFHKNVNAWMWILRGNDEIKGWEIAPSKKNLNEYGGRFQMPLFKGEIAASYHYRQADYSKFFPVDNPADKTYYPENMIGLDGKWDVGVGIWFEFVNKQNHPDNIFTTNRENYLNVGMDYTFQLGNGLNVTSEFFYYTNNAETKETLMENKFSALAVNYPFGISNTISTIVYYDWVTNNWYRLINLSKDYDYWSFYILAYWNPDQVIYESGGGNGVFAGKGIQLMAVVNF